MNLKGDNFFNILRVQTQNKSKTNSTNLLKESKSTFFSLTGFMHIPLEKTTIDTSEPYTGAMRGTVHEPQANLGANQNFSPGRS